MDAGFGRRLLTVSLTIRVREDFPDGCVPALTGDGLLGAWDPEHAVPMEPEGNHTWRLHLLVSEGSHMAFNFAALNSGERTLAPEEGGRRHLVAGNLQPRPADEGGQTVRITVRGSMPLLPDAVAEAFPGCTSRAECVFDIARVFAAQTGTKRTDFWDQSPSSASKPPLAVRPPKPDRDDPSTTDTTPPWQSATPFVRDSKDREKDKERPGRSKSPVPASSFQDLVLLDRAESSPAQPANAASSRSPSGCERSPESSLENLARKISATLSLDRSASERSEPDEPSQGRAASGADGAAALSGPAPSPFTASSKESPTRAALLSRRTSGPKADSSRPPTSGGAGASERRRLAIIMVGLPARGKTFTAQKLARYLNWLGHDTKHFNVGKYRRDFVGSSCSAEFFAADNAEAVKSRNEVARICLADMLAWMEGGGQVAIFDATNSTVQRRSMVTDTLRGMCKIIFLETICTDREMIERNVAEKIHRSPDYTGTDPQEAKRDFMMRMAEYEKAYEPLGDSELQWASSIHVIDIASGAGTMQVSRIQGYLPGRIVYFLLNAHLSKRPIYFCRHGKSEDNVAGKIGGDSVLSPAGVQFSQKLRRFLDALPASERPAAIWTSTLKRTVQTALPMSGWPKVQWRALDEIDAGACDGMAYAEIQQRMPAEYEARVADKLRYRYPRGESYLDVIARLEPVTIELERQRAPVLIIAHQAVLRCLYAYFMSKKVEEVPHLDMPLHTVVKIAPSSYGVQDEKFPLMEENESPPIDEAKTPPPQSEAAQHEFSR